VIIYAVTSELFSPNSPTVLYGHACDRIKASKKVAVYLQGPLAFHNNPPSAIRPRHRNRHVSSQIFVDSAEREHLILNFYVQGKSLGSSSTLTNNPSEPYFDTAVHWTGDIASLLSQLTREEAVEWAKEQALNAWERSKRVFRYLSGTPLPPISLLEHPPVDVKESKKAESGGWSFVGIFSALRGSSAGSTETNVKRADGEMFTDGEVHAALVRNDDGYFEFRYLLVDIPNSGSRDRLRIFVEQSSGVRKNEATL